MVVVEVWGCPSVDVDATQRLSTPSKEPPGSNQTSSHMPSRPIPVRIAPRFGSHLFGDHSSSAHVVRDGGSMSMSMRDTSTVPQGRNARDVDNS